MHAHGQINGRIATYSLQQIKMIPEFYKSGEIWLKSGRGSPLFFILGNLGKAKYITMHEHGQINGRMATYSLQ